MVALGYELYDPFGGLFGKAYAQSVRVFVAPPIDGWTRIMGELDEKLLAPVSEWGLCLSAVLEEGQSRIEAYRDGAEVDLVAALEPHLRPGLTVADLQTALSGSYAGVARSGDAGGVPLDVLPDDVQEMAKGLDRKRINKMLGRFMRGMGRPSNEDQEFAHDILAGSQMDWNSPGGQCIQAVMACLTIPETWREPDFVAVRDAYQLRRRRQRHPNAFLLPGDDTALATVPDALDYIPVYGGIAHKLG